MPPPHIIARRGHEDVLPPLIHIRRLPPAQLSTSATNGCDRQQHSYDIKARPQFCHADKKKQADQVGTSATNHVMRTVQHSGKNADQKYHKTDVRQTWERPGRAITRV